MGFAEIMLQRGRKRIAICFSGQLRTWRSCIDSWHNILLHNGRDDNIDIFCHLWDYNTLPNCVDIKQEIQIIDKSEINELLDKLKPKKFLIESKKEFLPHHPDQAMTYSPFLSQFYGIMQAARLKKEYEIENDLMYDAVVRCRYDALYLNRLSDIYSSIDPGYMHGFHIGWDYLTNRGRIGDICWIADSQTYDIIADYYINNRYIDKKWFTTIKSSKIYQEELKIVGEETAQVVPEYVFFHYIKKNKIPIKNYNNWNIKLFRYSKDLSVSENKDGFETW